jgi:protein-L-isoaspartate(D-aspartate) O-methyltransferase
MHMTDLAVCRQAYANEIDELCKLKTRALVDALATVPREAFLPPGPWLVRSDRDIQRPRQTEDADPRRVYHNYAIAIDPGRQLFNGVPSFLLSMIDALAIAPGSRILHVGSGPGYYTALMAHVVGSRGRILAIEVDPDLARQATNNLAAMSWVEVRHGDATAALHERFDAILVNAGVTHPQDTWLDALSANGRLILPLTATMPALGPLGKGFMTIVTKSADGIFAARPLSMVMIYSAIGLRDETINAQLGQAFMRSPIPAFTRLRRDRHDAGPDCWLHTEAFCLSTDRAE